MSGSKPMDAPTPAGTPGGGGSRARRRTGRAEGAPERPAPGRAIGYGRVSKLDDDDNGHSLDAQRAVVTAEAERRGWAMEWVADPGKSGKRINPALRDALTRLAVGRADALIVAKMDRLARSVSHAADIMQLAEHQGWDLVMCDLAIDLSTPQGEAMANMLATFAQFERRMISTRTKEGLAAAKAKGVRLGAPVLVPPRLAERIVAEREQHDMSFGAIARALTADGELSPAGRPDWQASTVRRIYERSAS
jgi:DNA invertase Pin-like site-specific DNA recombinase